MSAPDIDKDLIKKYLTGNANELEKSIVEDFMQYPRSQEVFHEVWKQLHTEMNEPSDNEVDDPIRMQVWKKSIRQTIEQNTPGHQATKIGKYDIISRYVAIWAILLLCGAVWGISKFIERKSISDIEWITHVNPNGKKAVIRLSDSTMVYLGAGSSLKYPKRFKGDKREVQLKGEAFFEVAEDPEKCFLVISEEVVTQVLGTSFKVESFVGSPTLVSVSTGKVRVAQISNGQEYILADLTAGQQLVWNKQMGVAKTDLTASTSSAEDFMGGKLIFEDRPLAEITKTLERNYNINIDIQRTALSSNIIRITLEKDLALKQAMEVLAAVGGFSYTLDKDKNQVKIF